MNVISSTQVRHLVLSFERGDELPGDLLRALEGARVRAGSVAGSGVLASAEIALFDADGRTYQRARRFDGPAELVSLAGSVAQQAGVTTARLSVTLARETELGLAVSAGILLAAKVVAAELFVVSFDDLSLSRAPDEAALALASASDEASAARARAGGDREASAGAPMPTRPMPRTVEPEFYPEVGDAASHFHFGECTIIGAEGERIRLRQDRDGRIREVSLTMLRVEPPTVDADGKRHFRLLRKQ